MNDKPLITISNLQKTFIKREGLKRVPLKAVDNVSLNIYKGETLGLVGESGCGKSTLGRLILRLIDKTDGIVTFEEKDIYEISKSDLVKLRRDMQIVFQDPYACLNPRLKIGDIIAEPLKFHEKLSSSEVKKRVADVMNDVGLNENMAGRFPHELSGGQQQRVGIARALILRPKFIVCDEPVSALDVSVQAQILNLMVQIKEEYKLTYLFISHNLAVIHHLCDRIAVMYLGQIVEIADKEELFNNPLHPYTKALISAILPVKVSTKERIILQGDLPDPTDPPTGCRFKTRCSCSCDNCNQEQRLVEISDGHFVRCNETLMSAPGAGV